MENFVLKNEPKSALKLKKQSWWRSPSRVLLIFNLIFIVIIFSLGVFTKILQKDIGQNDLAYYNGNNLTLIGRVCEEADVDYKSRRLTVCVTGQTKGQVLVTTNLYPIYDYGNFLEISGELKSPPLIDGFDYESYLARYDIYSVMYYPKINIFGDNQDWLSMVQKIFLRLIRVKQYVKAIIDSNLPEPEAGLADALLLGYRRTVSREDLNVFSRVGLSHLIAISGSHITILSAMALNFLLALGFYRRRALKIIFIFLFLYPLITGLSASAVRSALMGALALLAIYYERLSTLVRALIFAGALMLAFNPRLLRDDIGFQLSFLALLGIIYIYPFGERITRRFLKNRNWRVKTKNIGKNILDTVNLTLVSQIVILPIALIDFKQLSVIAPLANVLVLWAFAPLLAALIIGILMTVIIPSLGIIFLAPVYLLLRFIFFVAKVLAAPSWTAIAVSDFTWYFGAVYYLILALSVIRARNKARKRRRAR